MRDAILDLNYALYNKTPILSMGKFSKWIYEQEWEKASNCVSNGEILNKIQSKTKWNMRRSCWILKRHYCGHKKCGCKWYSKITPCYVSKKNTQQIKVIKRVTKTRIPSVTVKLIMTMRLRTSNNVQIATLRAPLLPGYKGNTKTKYTHINQKKNN